MSEVLYTCVVLLYTWCTEEYSCTSSGLCEDHHREIQRSTVVVFLVHFTGWSVIVLECPFWHIPSTERSPAGCCTRLKVRYRFSMSFLAKSIN
uniref:Secreted protein n=1 Tax=Trichuris muris TaxID=70415 RepID=A0A5S6Q5W1_TRIMR